MSKQNDWTIAPWIRPAFARQFALPQRSRAKARQQDRSLSSVGLSFALHSIASRTGDVTRWAVGLPRGVEVAHPFLDPRVLALGLGIQRRIPATPDRLKPVLAEATKGLLPEAIRSRRRKGQFNEVYYLGLAKNLRMLEAMVAAAPVDGLGIFDKAMLLTYLRQAALGGAHVRALHRLNLTLSLLKWMSMQPEWRSTASPPSQVLRLRWADTGE